MKKLAVLIFLILSYWDGFGQVKIHSHNDYEQDRPFYLAYEQRAYEIEADVFESDGQLLVAHSKRNIDQQKTLQKLYLDPIDSLFKLFKGRASKDRGYTFVFMIDFKTDWQPTFEALQKLLSKYPKVFDRSQNALAVQIVISGNRPPQNTFHTYPKWLYFDGLPNVAYANEDLKRVTMISDNFSNYSKWRGSGAIPSADAEKLKKVITEAHQLKKPIRFWGAPDTEDCWRQLVMLGADILNTDHLEKSTQFLTDLKR